MENIAEHEKRKREAEDRALLIRLCDKYHYTHMMTRSRATAEDLKGYIDRWTLFGADADVVKTFCGMMSVDYSSYDSDFDAYDAAVAEYNSRK